MPREGTPSDHPLFDEVESVARIGSYALDIGAGRWVSSKGLDAIFGIAGSFERTVEGWASLVHPDDRDAMLAYFAGDVLGRKRPFDRQYRVVRADTGATLWVHGRGRLEFNRAGEPIRMIGTIADITDHRQALDDLRDLEAHDRLLALAVQQTSEAILITSPTGVILHANPAFKRLNGIDPDAPIGGNADALGSLRSPLATADVEAAVAGGESWTGDAIIHRQDGEQRLVEASVSPVQDDQGVRTGLISVARDVTLERALAAERDRLAAAVAATSDAVIIADLAGTILYINAAFERTSGYGRDEAIGQNPRILKSGRQSKAVYRAMWRRLTRGETWNGTLVNRRKDGSLYEEEVTISPMRGLDGQPTGYVGVKRDVTALRAAETNLEGEFRERAAVAAALARIQPGGSVEATSAEICDQLTGLAGIDAAAIFAFVDGQRAVTLAVAGPDELRRTPGQPMPAGPAAYLRERAAHGAWAEEWRQRPEFGPYGAMMTEAGIRAIAYAPIRSGASLLGVVAAATRDEDYVRHLIDRLPAVGEFASTASALLGEQIQRGLQDDAVRERVRSALAEGGLGTIFQPIVRLSSRNLVGHEALTRFADGTPPDRMIADAHSVGLGRELEVACIAAALKASEALDTGYWLSVNASPEVVVQATELASLVRARPRRIVIEVTEHIEIKDYGAVREAMANLGPTVQLSVDDAGSGFASLQHVVELNPQFLKIDISLVHDVDRDAMRQAMIAGLVHFAARVGCQVIAEGIEQQAELDMLRELGVTLGQGFLLGRPGPLPGSVG